jgi:hypothetical protein
MRKSFFLLAVLLSAVCTQAQNREMFHSADITYGFAMPMGDFKSGYTEDLSGGNALTGAALNISIHDEIKEFIGGVIKYGYRQNGRRVRADHDFFSKVGPVEIYGDNAWRINHLAIGPQFITPVSQAINVDFYMLLGVQWGYVPELEMVMRAGRSTIQYYYTYSPFIAASGIAGADVRVHIVKGISFVTNAEFLFCKPNIEYSALVTYNGEPASVRSIDKKKAVPINILSLTGGISLAF